MGILIFLGTAVIIYIVLNKLNNKETYNNSWNSKINLDLNEGYRIINSNISDDKLILTINNKTHYKIIIYDLKKNSKISDIRIDCVNDVCFNDCPFRLVVKDAAFSRQKHEFNPRKGHQKIYIYIYNEKNTKYICFIALYYYFE